MSTTTVMQEDKRGEPSKKPPLRLPVIAPKDDHSSSTSSSRSGQPSITPRARLPPRSRTGCWTCRTRKVKCDEGRPVCGQCSRLGHVCDYNPRLSFRDDTPRVVERMQEVTIVGSSIWDSQSPAATETSQGSLPDDLPPFAQLLTDDERERKAERSSPGTYQVLVNPDSFAHLPEYSDESQKLSPLRRGSLATSLTSSLGRDEDPNTIVLPRFEDVARRVTAKEPPSPVLIRIKSEDEEDRHMRQFKQIVWNQLVPAELGRTDSDKSSATLFENEARTFLPLQHAIKAVAAFSLNTDNDRVDALQHYQEAVSSLKEALNTTEDLASDGSLFTHFLLMIHEIAAAEVLPFRQHLLTLLQISGLRRSLYGTERYPFIIWWLSLIDIEAIFSGASAGEFVATLLKSDLIPPPSYHLYPLGVDGSSIVYGNELDSLPVILQLNHEVSMLAVRLAILGREFREMGDGRLRHGHIYELQEALRELWAAPSIMLMAQNTNRLPVRPKRLFEHAQTLYRACIIYSHTSMWSTQRIETPPEYDTEISVAANQILTSTSRLLDQGLTDARFLVFPTFIAGFACHDGAQKILALELIDRLDRAGVGRNTAAARRGLELVYKRQNERFMMTGQSLDVDWLQVLQEEQITIVNFGL